MYIQRLARKKHHKSLQESATRDDTSNPQEKQRHRDETGNRRQGGRYSQQRRIPNTKGPQTKLRKQTDLQTHQPHEFRDRINSTIAKKHNFHQWKNTAAVIDWFKFINNKQRLSFICFDIEEFYPSISQDLLMKALDFASDYDNTTTDERNINIIHDKSSILIQSITNPGKRKATQHSM